MALLLISVPLAIATFVLLMLGFALLWASDANKGNPPVRWTLIVCAGLVCLAIANLHRIFD